MNAKDISSSNDSFLSISIDDSSAIERPQAEVNTINSLKVYYTLNHQFKALGRSELTERMLRRITKCDYIPKDFQTRPLYVNLSGIVDELMLNELEIALWAIYLEKLVWENFEIYTERLLLFTAYKAKQFFNGNSIEPYRIYLNAKIKNFEKNIKSWLVKYENGFKANLQMINKKLNLLKIVKDTESDYCFLNYNYYVDLILLTAAPYADRSDQIILLKSEERVNIEELKDNNIVSQQPMKRKKKTIQKTICKKMKIGKEEYTIDNIDPAEKDPDIKKIEKFCDGLMDYNDFDPDNFLKES